MTSVQAVILIFLEISLFIKGFLEGDFLVKKKGEEYACEECGLVVVVQDPCGCEACEILCCEQPMKPARAKAKSAPVKAPKAEKTNK